MSKRTVYIGIDPGVNGGVAVYSPSTQGIKTSIPILFGKKMPESIKEIAEFFKEQLPKLLALISNSESVGFNTPLIAIEKQIPRPTRWNKEDKETGEITKNSTVLASTSILYGNYMAIRGILSTLDMDYGEVDPKKWQTALGLKRTNHEKDSQWKGRLQRVATEVFPTAEITRQTADAFLLVNYLMLTNTVEK